MWERLSTFLREVRNEFSKVSWPTRDDLASSTGVVLVFSAIFAVFIGIFDLVISFIWGILIGR
jgi:preprotein translocase subunit SecE